jgi:hypothetical protein
MSSMLIKPPPDSDASSLLPLVTQAEHDQDEDAALVLLDNGQSVHNNPESLFTIISL